MCIDRYLVSSIKSLKSKVLLHGYNTFFGLLVRVIEMAKLKMENGKSGELSAVIMIGLNQLRIFVFVFFFILYILYYEFFKLSESLYGRICNLRFYHFLEHLDICQYFRRLLIYNTGCISIPCSFLASKHVF